MHDRVKFICDKENVVLDGDALNLLGDISGGDLRKAVTTLQSAVRLGGSHVQK